MNNKNNENPKKGNWWKTGLKWTGVVTVIAGVTYVLATNKWGSRDKVVSGAKASGNWVKGLFTKSEVTTTAHEQQDTTVGCTNQQPQYEQQPAQRNFERRDDRRDQRREFNNSYKH